jgi:hypothetical protein
MLLLNRGLAPTVAATRSGLGPEAFGRECWPSGYSRVGVWEPVPKGVDMLDGSSEVNIVAEEGDIRYRDVIV